MQFNLENTIYYIVNNLVGQISSLLNYKVKSNEIQNYYNLISSFRSILIDFEQSLYISIIVSNVIVLIIFICSLLMLTHKFKYKILHLRKSKWKIEKALKEYKISDASYFTGQIIGNTAI